MLAAVGRLCYVMYCYWFKWDCSKKEICEEFYSEVHKVQSLLVTSELSVPLTIVRM